MEKRILITGGTGFIGRELCRALSGRGDDVTVLSRHVEAVPGLCGKAVKEYLHLMTLKRMNPSMQSSILRERPLPTRDGLLPERDSSYQVGSTRLMDSSIL